MKKKVATVIVLYETCFACRGTGLEPGPIRPHRCIWCEGRGRRRPRAAVREGKGTQS